MNFSLPFYHNPGITYSEGYAHEYAVIFIIHGVKVFGLSTLVYLISSILQKIVISRTQKIIVDDEDSETNMKIDESALPPELLSLSKSNRNKLSNLLFFIIKIIKIISGVLSWYGILVIAFVPAILSGLGVIPITASMFFITIILTLRFIIEMAIRLVSNFTKICHKKEQRKDLRWFWKSVQVSFFHKKWRLILFIIFALMFVIGAPMFTADTCITYFNPFGRLIHNRKISTRLSRYFELDTVCPLGTICHVYATLPEETSSGVILNVHTGIDVSSIIVAYGVESSETLFKNTTAQSWKVDLETRGARYVHSAYLGDLEPNQKYTYRIYFNGKMQRNGTYHTLPTKNLERNLKIATGGDVGNLFLARKMTTALSEHELDAIIIGGDVAYDNGSRACYYSWDLFFRMFEALNTKTGRLVPLILGIGNHDVGFGATKNGKFEVSKNLFFAYFPQQSEKDPNGNLLSQVPDIQSRTAYTYHTLGNTIQFILDSGYLIPHQQQLSFMNKTLHQFKDRIPMATYHEPMYPACYSRIAQAVFTNSRKFWAPFFEKFKFMAVFENHVHAYKKTFPIKKGKKASIGTGGVEYFGDGNWGSSPAPCSEGHGKIKSTGLIEASSNSNHVWIMEIEKEQVSFYAINTTGRVFDKRYTILIDRPTLSLNKLPLPASKN